MTEELDNNCDDCGLETNGKPDLELFINDKRLQTGNIGISWCISKRALDALKKELAGKSYKPYLLLIIGRRPDEKTEDELANNLSLKERRYIVPLMDLITYKDLHLSGECFIFGAIVWGTRAFNFIDASDTYDDNGYWRRAYAINYERDRFNKNNGSSFFLNKTFPLIDHVDVESALFSIAATCRLNIDVPKGIFAKEPSELEKAWVNWLHKKKAVDQCDFRRRRLIAYFPLFQPLLFTILYLGRLCISALLLLTLHKGINFNPLIHPLDNDTARIGVDAEFMLDGWYLLFLPLLPIVWVPWLFILPLFVDYTILQMVMLYFKCLAYLYGGVIVIGLLAYVFFKLFPALFEYLARDEVDWYNDEEEARLLVCSPDRKGFRSLKDLPRKHRTIKLRFLDLKADICRPFSE